MFEANDRLRAAIRELGRSVVSVNPKIAEELKSKDQPLFYFGVKDTDQIPDTVVDKLRRHKNFIWLTVDKMADRGRAIDTDLINPLTYRVMTGSTSGGPINILKGITDFAVGTDGGGSVLAPAMSCQLPAVIGAGLGLFVKKRKVSTDGIEFSGSIGVIAKTVKTLTIVMEYLTGKPLTGSEKKKWKIVIPKKGSLICPDGTDMNEKVLSYLSKINEKEWVFEEAEMTGTDDRKTGIQVIKKYLYENDADLIVTCEGPVDVFGYGETLPKFFGKTGEKITQNHGKYLLRAANMCQTTAIAVPVDQLASGLLIIAKKGEEQARIAFDFALKMENIIRLPEIWRKLFLSGSVSRDGFQFQEEK